MKTRTMFTATVDGYLKLLRRPAEFAIGLLPGDRTGPRATASVVLDRVDATLRTLAASALGDEALKQDAHRREAAAAERGRAVDLRREAEEKADRAEARVQTRHQEAAGRRERASAQAGARRRDATEKQRSRTRHAEESERQRIEASRDREQRAAQRIDAEAAESRLPAVAEQARALDEREGALDRGDEARRLGEAAARVKEERKEG